MKRGFRKGFTLIELLIVLAVIAALLAVVTPIALNAVRKAELTKIASNLRNIKSAAETYITIANPSEDKGDLLQELKDNGYLTTKPEGYSAELEYSTDVSTVTIKYTGEGVTAKDLLEIYSEVSTNTEDNNKPQVVFTIKSW